MAAAGPGRSAGRAPRGGAGRSARAARYGAGSRNGGSRRSSAGGDDQRRQAFGVDLGQREHHVGGADRLLAGGVAVGPGPLALLRRERRLGQQVGDAERGRDRRARASPATCGRRGRSARRAGAVPPAFDGSAGAAGRRPGPRDLGCGAGARDRRCDRSCAAGSPARPGCPARRSASIRARAMRRSPDGTGWSGGLSGA